MLRQKRMDRLCKNVVLVTFSQIETGLTDLETSLATCEISDFQFKFSSKINAKENYFYYLIYFLAIY